MKIKKNFVLRNVADTWMVLPLGEETVNFTNMMTLNESGAMLWGVLETGCDKADLIEALTREYEVTEETAAADVESFLERLTQAGCLEG